MVVVSRAIQRKHVALSANNIASVCVPGVQLYERIIRLDNRLRWLQNNVDRISMQTQNESKFIFEILFQIVPHVFQTDKYLHDYPNKLNQKRVLVYIS